MPLLTALTSSLHSTRSAATSCIPSTTSRPPAAGLSGKPVEAARTGGNEPEVSSVLPVMEFMDMDDLGMCWRMECAISQILIRLLLAAALLLSFLPIRLADNALFLVSVLLHYALYPRFPISVCSNRPSTWMQLK